MPHIPKEILVFYELYNIPNIYREIMTEIIMNNRLLEKHLIKCYCIYKSKNHNKFFRMGSFK